MLGVLITYIMLNTVMLSVDMPSVVITSIMLNTVMLSAFYYAGFCDYINYAECRHAE
jgi:hypothetical protein